MHDTLLQAYQTEFETTEISIDELCKKYNLTKRQLKGYKTWSKQEYQQTKEDYANHQQQLLVTLPPQTSTTTDTSKPPLVNETMLEKIERFKVAAVDRALLFIETEAQLAEVKEFKDVVAIIDSIEKSYIKQSPADGDKGTVNIFIQNLMQNFKDDC